MGEWISLDCLYPIKYDLGEASFSKMFFYLFTEEMKMVRNRKFINVLLACMPLKKRIYEQAAAVKI